MSRYLLDGRALDGGSAVRGIGTYLRGLLTGFNAIGVAGDVRLLLERGQVLAGELAAAGFSEHPATLRRSNRHLGPVLDPFRVRRALTISTPALYHAIEYAQPLAPPVPVVVTVHDLIPFVMPRLYPWMACERALALSQIRHADAVIAVSRSTSSDLQRIAGVDPHRIAVIPHGVTTPPMTPDTDIETLQADLRLPRRFLLAVGTFDPRKRVALLVDVVRRVRQHHDVGLVVAGFQGGFAASVERAVEDAGLVSETRVLGHVPAGHLAALYQNSECLLFTSAYEGFGLPPLEAMAAGAPVAAFDNSSIGEVVGDAALLVEDGNSAAMATAVSALLGDPAERVRRVAMGRAHAATFSWARAAVTTLAVYTTVLETR